MFSFLNEVSESIVEKRNEITEILSGASVKFEFFMGHKLRAFVQDKRITEMMEWVREGREGTRVMVYIDYKMK